MRSWADVEAGVLDALADLAPGSNETPADLDRRLTAPGSGFYRVRRIGGQPVDEVTDAAQVDVETFAVGRDAAFTLARAAWDRLTLTPGLVGGPVRFDRITTVLAPFEAPNDNPRVTRFLATYRVTARRQ